MIRDMINKQFLHLLLLPMLFMLFPAGCAHKPTGPLNKERLKHPTKRRDLHQLLLRRITLKMNFLKKSLRNVVCKWRILYISLTRGCIISMTSYTSGCLNLWQKDIGRLHPIFSGRALEIFSITWRRRFDLSTVSFKEKVIQPRLNLLNLLSIAPSGFLGSETRQTKIPSLLFLMMRTLDRRWPNTASAMAFILCGRLWDHPPCAIQSDCSGILFCIPSIMLNLQKRSWR